MDALAVWDDWSAEQWLDEADRFERMAQRFHDHPQLTASFKALARDALARSSLVPAKTVDQVPEYDWSRLRRTDEVLPTPADIPCFRLRRMQQQTATLEANDVRVRRVHFEMADRYRALAQGAEADCKNRAAARPIINEEQPILLQNRRPSRAADTILPEIVDLI